MLSRFRRQIVAESTVVASVDRLLEVQPHNVTFQTGVHSQIITHNWQPL